LLGQKSYELSNHLGNVQATLSDKRYVQKQYYTASDSLRKGFAASVSSLYDYYPFGMLMKERCTSDTATQSVYMSQVVYSPQYTTVNNAMTGASITSLNTTTQTNYNGSVNYFGQSASINKTLSNLQSGIPVSMKINLLYTNKPLYLTVQQGSTLLYSTTMNSSGTYSFNFTPTQSTVQLSIAYSYFNTNANTLCFTLDSVNYTQQNGSTSSTQLVQISSKQNDKYRFGYGGHEKMNEISGLGNTIDMGDRWLNTRIGRTPKTDLHKIKYPNLSPYSYAANNPIVFYDPDGKDYRLSIIKNNQGKILIVSAHATVYLQGAGASQEMANNLNKQFLDKYNGYKNVDGVNVAFFVNYIYDGKNEKNKNNLGMGQNIFEIRTDLEKDYRSRVFAESHVLGSKFQTGNTGIINYKSSKFSQTVFHETLHLMGLSDRYDEFNNNLFKGIEIHKGFNKDIMGGGDKILDVHYENLLNYAKSKNMSFILQDNKQYDRASLSELKNGSKPNTTYHEMSEQAKNK
jgi:RHS repeat-associated protein